MESATTGLAAGNLEPHKCMSLYSNTIRYDSFRNDMRRSPLDRISIGRRRSDLFLNRIYLQMKSILVIYSILVSFATISGHDDDFGAMENDTLPDFTQLEHFINGDNEEQNE